MTPKEKAKELFDTPAPFASQFHETNVSPL